MRWALVAVLSLGVMTLAFHMGYGVVCDGIRAWLLQTPSTVPLMVAAIHMGQFVTGMQTPPDPCSYEVGWSFYPIYTGMVLVVVVAARRCRGMARSVARSVARSMRRRA